jgi:hypothetical protein
LGRECKINGITLDLYDDYNEFNNNVENVDFDLNEIIIMHRVITKVTEKVVDDEVYNFDDLNEDLANGVIYGRDNTGELYRILDRKKVYVKDMTISEANCAGSGLNYDDKKKCSLLVADCLLRGDNHDLSLCLERLADEDMFAKANEELEKMHPDIAIKILTTFKVRKGPNSEGIETVESFDSWVDNVVKKMSISTRDTILGNSNLLEYLKGVIAFVRKNPTILNKDLTDVVHNCQDDMNEMDTRMGKRPFYFPVDGSKENLLFKGELLSKYAGSIYAREFPSISTLPYTNTFVGPSIVAGIAMRGQTGGNARLEESIQRKYNKGELSSHLLYALTTQVEEDLKEAGMTLDVKDSKRIRNGVERIEEYEQKTFKLYRMLRSLADLLTFFKATGCTPSKLPSTIKITQLRDRADVLAYLEKNVSQLRGCIDQNNNKQINACNDLMKYLGLLFETAGGKLNPDHVNFN